MANTYTQLFIHIVFTVQGRNNLIAEKHREELERYIVGMTLVRNHKPLAIFCMPDHLHFLVGINPNQSLSDLVRDIKSSSSNFINNNSWMPGKFSWQEGYGAFSYSKSQVKNVITYIRNQPDHHQKNTFHDEYIKLLELFDIEYNPKYLFDWVD
ncbi:MAG: IS200/IS605 family transposase [Bacteroidetes bacterium]|nr:IS200/IS605 family transposase [Bacteroidota bacterium]